MRIKSKKTGEEITTANLIVGEGENYKSYSTIEELCKEWEDVVEAEPIDEGKFWCIGTTGELYRMEDVNSRIDIKLKKVGNYFKTRAEAKEAVEKIKEVLNEHGRNKENS